MAVTIIKDKEPIYDTDEYDVILLGVSVYDKFMGSFQAKMGVKYPLVEKVFYSTPHADLRKLGKRVTIDDMKPVVSLMFMCTYPSAKENFIDYNALERCLLTANTEFKGKKVMTTVVGSTRFDGRGDKEKCMKILKNSTKDLDLYVYDYEQLSIQEELVRQGIYFRNLREKYKGDNEMLKKIRQLAREMHKKTYIPPYLYNKKKKREEDEILNY